MVDLKSDKKEDDWTDDKKEVCVKVSKRNYYRKKAELSCALNKETLKKLLMN